MVNEKLKEILIIAEKNTEYYKEIFHNCGFSTSGNCENDFRNIPILTRSQLINNREIILHRDFKNLNRKNLIFQRTSGSTGQFVEILWKPQDYWRSTKCLWKKRKEWYGVSALDKKCTFFTTNHSNEKVRIVKNSMEFSSYFLADTDLEKYYEQMNAFKPQWLMLSPSIALILQQFCQKKNLLLPKSVKYIELFGENVSEAIYSLIREYFSVPVSIMYGAKEVNGIGLTCPNGKMHILEDNVYVEKMGNNKILITSLHNTVFPIIRYDIGDMVAIDKIECSCNGSKYGVVKLYGKEHYLTYLDKNTGATTNIIKNAINYVDETLGYPLLQMQIVFEKEDIYIHIYCKKNYEAWQQQIKNEIIKKISEYISKEFRGEIIFHNEPIPINFNTGKLPLSQIN